MSGQRPLPEHVVEVLGEPIVTSFDAYFRARARLTEAILMRDRHLVAAAVAEEREHLANWLALVVERLDGRTAHMLVVAFQRIETVEQALGLGRVSVDPPNGDGHDEMGVPPV